MSVTDFKSERCNPRRRKLGRQYYAVLDHLVALSKRDPVLLRYLHSGQRGKAWARLSTKYINSNKQNVFDIYTPDEANHVVNYAINTVAKHQREASTVARRTTQEPIPHTNP